MSLINIGATGLINRFDASKFVLPDEKLPDFQRGVDKTTQDMITNQLDLASRPTDERTGEIMAGISPAKEQVSEEPSPISTAPIKSVEDALSRRSSRDVNEGLGRLRRSSAITGESKRAEDLAKVSSNLGQVESIKLSNYQARLEYAQTLQKLKLMEEQARANVLSQILGGIATVAGFAIGGPVAAAAAAGGSAALKPKNIGGNSAGAVVNGFERLNPA